MYGVAIWDKVDRRLTLARDPIGIKPLFVTRQNGGLAFASEITALRIFPEHRFDLDAHGINDFFCFGHTLPPRSIYLQVEPLEPGHLLEIGPSNEPAIRRFWAPKISVRSGISEREWIEETQIQVQRTVEKHMLSDVPIGAFLSGGVDSSAIAAAMARSSASRFKAFTIGFPGSSRDETECHRILLDISGSNTKFLRSARNVPPRSSRLSSRRLTSRPQRRPPFRYGVFRRAPRSKSKSSCAARAAMKSSLATTASAGRAEWPAGNRSSRLWAPVHLSRACPNSPGANGTTAVSLRASLSKERGFPVDTSASSRRFRSRPGYSKAYFRSRLCSNP